MNKPLAALLGSLSLASCVSTCIARGMLVWTPRGKRPIEDLIEQDTVWCIDPSTGEKVASPITAVARATREVMQLEGEGFSLTCTTDHPLYDPRSKTWAPAGDWVLGQRTSLLLVPEDGAAPRAVEVHTRQVSAGISEVFDLTVMHELHNFVASGVLVHNKSIARQCEFNQENVYQGHTCTCADAGTSFVICMTKYDDAGTTSVGECSCE
ncbi:MAG: Hint domain-containing protein [Archangium sp.]|nr:Hint domain-containing protein [Archangium sp.]MDP3154304.1 Hint domain-containing protein [Archangium sp.]MDP3569718.1 Hint domain-containing protein [Archangium sp.]